MESRGNTERELLTKKGTEGERGDLSPILLEPSAGPGTGFTGREQDDQQVDGFGGMVREGGSQPQNLISFPKPVFWAALPCQVSA